MKDSKRFKDFRNELNENEYREVLTGYPNRDIHTDGPMRYDAEMIGRVNAMLNAISRGTYLHPGEAFLKIKTRLNILMLDFPWTPYLWQDGGVGNVTLTVTRYGRVDGVDALTGAVRTDGKANTMDGFREFILSAEIERAEDGLFRVNAKLMSKQDVQVEESAQVDEELVGKQHKLDVNKNKRLDAQDFKMLRAKKKPVKEEAEVVEEGKTAKIRRLQNRLGYKAANIRSGYAKDTPEAQAKIKKLKSVASKLSAKQEKTNQRRAETQFPHSDPKIAKMDWDQRARVKGGSLRAIVKRDKPVRWYNPKGRETQKEEANLEFTTGIPLQVPNPGDNIADPTKKGKRLHKKAK